MQSVSYLTLLLISREINELFVFADFTFGRSVVELNHRSKASDKGKSFRRFPRRDQQHASLGERKIIKTPICICFCFRADETSFEVSPGFLPSPRCWFCVTSLSSDQTVAT